MLITMREAIRLAIQEEMRADPSVVVFGEDVAAAGGVFKVTDGLLAEFGEARVRDTPIAETAILGAATGAAAVGLRPVVEIMFAEFFGVAIDQLTTEAAKMRYLSNGLVKVPLVVRASVGIGQGFGAQHTQTLESWFMNQPGLVMVGPSGPRSAYGLMRAAIRSDDPVVFLEWRSLYNAKEDFDPGEEPIAELGRARVVRDGSDVTLISFGQLVSVTHAAAERLADRVSCEVIDLATLVPWDRETVARSVERTGHVVIIEEDPVTGGWGADVAAAISEELFVHLESPVARIAAPDVPVPFGDIERDYAPSLDEIVRVVEHLLGEGVPPAPRWTNWTPNLEPRPMRPEFVARRAELQTPLGRLERLYEIRETEDAGMLLYSSGVLTGPIHTCQGHEAVSVGVASMLEMGDTVTCTYRGHGHALALGVTPLAVLAEMLGRVDGCVAGMGGSMHMSAPEVGLLPAFAIVGAGIPVAAGAALAAQCRQDGRIAVALFGDGASNIGAFHEGLNLAAIWKLPVIFVCENNLYGEYSALHRTTPVADIAARAGAYAMPSQIVDGQDLEAVRDAMGVAVKRARDGGGPTLLEMKTYRYSGHSRMDPAKYRAADELARWKARDPLEIYERAVIDGRAVSPEAVLAMKERVTQRVKDAVAGALASPHTRREDMRAHVTQLSDQRLAKRSVNVG